MNVCFSPAAQTDLMDIAVHIAQDNPARALTFVDELDAKCVGIGRTPGMGTTRPELGDGICMLPHGRYLIFYREHDDGAIRIERVVHAARDMGGDDFDQA
jgi:toxin ParE1/3/4